MPTDPALSPSEPLDQARLDIVLATLTPAQRRAFFQALVQTLGTGQLAQVPPADRLGFLLEWSTQSPPTQGDLDAH